MVGGCLLEPDALDPAHELAGFTKASQGCGAVGSFVGIARPEGKTGEIISGMLLDHHERLTLASMEDIAAATKNRFDIEALRIVHRCGLIAPNDPIVFVAASSLHRRAALGAVEYMMDRLKTDAVFWKREDSKKGNFWIEPTDADYAARSNWDDA